LLLILISTVDKHNFLISCNFANLSAVAMSIYFRIRDR